MVCISISRKTHQMTMDHPWGGGTHHHPETPAGQRQRGLRGACIAQDLSASQGRVGPFTTVMWPTWHGPRWPTNWPKAIEVKGIFFGM